MSLVLLTVSFSIKIIHTNIYLADLKFCGLRAVDIVAIVCQHSYFQPYQYITELFNLSFKVFFFTGFGVLPVASLGKVCSSSHTSALLPLPFPSVSFHVPVKKCLAWKTQRKKIYHGPQFPVRHGRTAPFTSGRQEEAEGRDCQCQPDREGATTPCCYSQQPKEFSTSLRHPSIHKPRICGFDAEKPFWDQQK